MRGTSCSGKDTFIKQHFEDPQTSSHVISSDRFREMMFGTPVIQRYNKQVFDVLYQVLESRISSHVKWTVYNATNLKMSDCNKAIEICKKYRVPYTIISISPPTIDELHHRSLERRDYGGLYIPESVLEKHYHNYYNNMQYFVEEAVNSKLCSLIEIDQDYQVIKRVD